MPGISFETIFISSVLFQNWMHRFCHSLLLSGFPVLRQQIFQTFIYFFFHESLWMHSAFFSLHFCFLQRAFDLVECIILFFSFKEQFWFSLYLFKFFFFFTRGKEKKIEFIIHHIIYFPIFLKPVCVWNCLCCVNLMFLYFPLKRNFFFSSTSYPHCCCVYTRCYY
jgi:hypothetical protein